VSRRVSVSVNQLRRELEWVASWAEFEPLDQLVGAPATDERSASWKVAVTFDDGYYDNLSLALPCLEEMSIPSTWFIATRFLTHPANLPWWDLLDLVERRVHAPLSFECGDHTFAYDLRDACEARRFRCEQREAFLHADTPEALALRKSRLEEVARQHLSAVPRNGFMSRDELRSVAASQLVTIGGHTVSHPNLVRLSPSEQHHELAKGRQQLRAWTEQPVRWLAYPFGGAEFFSTEVAAAAKRAGFDGAVTLIPNYVRHASSSYFVPRLSVEPTWSIETFKARVLGADVYRAGRSLLAPVSEWS
jgi:peptidoglycan/xylan/chitin deacetylase (PgdA/CDA1 family)